MGTFDAKTFWRKREEGNSFDFDTLSTDLTSMASTIGNVYSSWQTPETMRNTKSSIQSMYDRIGKYQEYQQKYGGADLSELQAEYQSVLDNWDDLAYSYSGYKSADAWKKSVAETEGMKTADLGVVQKEITDLEGILAEAKPFDDKLKELKASQSAYEANKNRIMGDMPEGYYSKPITETSGKLDEYLKSVGYGSVEEIEKTLGEKKVYHTNASRLQNLIKMSSVGDVNSENYDKDYNKYVESGKNSISENAFNIASKSKNEDFQYMVYEAGGRLNEFKPETAFDKFITWADEHFTTYNDARAVYDNVTEKELNDFYYYVGKDNEDGGNRAEEYVKLIMDSLNSRRGKDIAETVKNTPWGEAGFAIVAGLDQAKSGIEANFSDEDYIPYSPIQQASGRVRHNISEEYGSFATGAYDFGVTASNMLPSILASTVMNYILPGSGVLANTGKIGKIAGKIGKIAGKIGKIAGKIAPRIASSASMFVSARGNAYQEMLNLGYDKKQASTYGTLVGASEVGLQALLGGISKLGTSATGKGIEKLVSMIDNGFARFAIRYPLSIASEGAEEGLQEILNPLFKNIAAGYDTGAKVDWGEVAYSTLLGALMGGFFEGVPLAKGVSRETRFNNALGQNIKANERVGDILNLANNPEMGEAYETYTEFAKKGINADNISNYKLGRLSSMLERDAQAIYDSKKSTDEQKDSAKNILDTLKVYSQGNAGARTGSAKNFDKKWAKKSYDKESTVSMIADGLESAEGTESHKLAVEYMKKMGLTESEVTDIHTKILEGKSLTKEESSKLEGMKNLSVDEITKLSDANDAAIRAEESLTVTEELVERGESKEVAEIVSRKMRGETITTEEATKLNESENAYMYIAEKNNADNVTEELLTMAKSMPKKDAALFVALYDGKTDVEAYANAFNLAVMKSENNFSEDEILRTKNVLSNEQVAKIFEDVRIKADKEKTDRFRKLVEATADKKFYKGFINESVIDYNNTSAEGKVNWKDLTDRQRKAITFMNGFAKATGLRLVWMKDDEQAHGKYNRTTNTLYLDVNAGINDKLGLLTDTIIPTASHELTHWMEKKSPEFFRKINNLVFSTLYEADGKSEEDRIKEEMANTGKSEAIARSEIVARACEEVLSKSEQGKKIFNSLSESEKKTFVDKIKEIIQDIVDWVNDFLGLYGEKSLSDEAKIMRQYKDKLNELVKLWDAMLEESVEVNQAQEKSGEYGNAVVSRDSSELLSARNVDGKNVVWIEENILKKNEGQPIHQFIADFIAEHIGEAYTIFESGQKVYIGEDLPGEYTQSQYTQTILRNNPNIIKVKNKASANIGEIIEIATNRKWEKAEHEDNKDAKYGIYKYNTRFGFPIKDAKGNTIGANIYKAKLVIRNASDGKKYLYDIVSIKKDNASSDWLSKKIASTATKIAVQKNDVSANSILNSDRNVKGNISDRDSSGRELSKGQQEYFKDSKVRDEDGNLKVMYRGDSSEFTVFDRKKTKHSNLYGRGFYFTNSKAHAEQYGKAREFYLNIKNPLASKQNVITKNQMLAFLKAIENDGEDYDLYNYGEGSTAESVLSSVWGKGDFEMLQDVNASAIGDLVAAVELFNEVNGTRYDGIILPTETVTFKSNQAKSTSNLNPTEDEDILFSMRENVEETRDLVAVHNLSAEKLLKSLKLGGLPMPSIAITRAREGHNSFGDISLVFGKDTINPEFMRSNKVFSGDAWTPTYPRIEYKLNTKAQETIKKKIDSLVSQDIQRDLGGLHLDSTNMEYDLNRNGEMVSSYRYNSAMKYAFLKDNGVDFELPRKEKPFYRYGEVSNNAVISFAHKMVEGLKTVNSLLEQHSSKIMADKDLINGIATVLNEDTLSNLEGNAEAYKHFSENPLYKPEDIDLSTVLEMLEAARRYFNANGITESEVDYREARSLIDEKTDMTEYEAWLKDLFSDVIDKEGIRNDKDLFTPSGNRRSFEALHYEHTLENVIKAMKAEGLKGVGGFGGGNIFGASTNEYSSIEEIKADAEKRMKSLPESEYDAIKKGFSDRLFEMANSLPIHKDSFTATDNAANMLIEAVSKFKTKSGMANYLRTESKGWANYTDHIVDDLVDLVTDIRNMPVAYFEAKPQRAVEFNEVKAVIMPKQSSSEKNLAEVKSELEKLNIPILEYERGDNNARLDALNSLEDDVLFSEREDIIDSNTERTFSYDELVAKGEIHGVTIKKNQQVKLTADGEVDVISLMKEIHEKCEKIETKSEEPTYYVEVPDISRNVVIARKGVEHGFIKNLESKGAKFPPQARLNARVSLELPEILKNSIEVNRSFRDRSEDVPYTHVMLGTVAMENEDGTVDYYAVRLMVEEKINQGAILTEANILGKLKAINAKKVGLPQARVIEDDVALTSSKSYTYNIAELLENVKTEFNDTFSLDVYEKLGMTRFKNEFSDNLLLSEREDISIYELMRFHTAEGDDVLYSEKDVNKISLDTTDEERTIILSNKSIVAPIYKGQADEAIAKEIKNLESEKIGLVKKAIEIIGEDFAPIGEDINIKDAEVTITLSKSNLKESVTKDVTPIQLAKLLPILKESLSNSIAVERHSNRYYFDTDTVYFDNLLGGYVEDSDFVPVRFGLKHSKNGKTTLYVVVDQDKIPKSLIEENKKTEVVKTTGPQYNANPSASRSVNYSILQIIPFVKSKDLLRYLPDGMLTDEQKDIKWKAISETIIYTDEKNDKKYLEYISKGNLQAAGIMVREAARKAGYTKKAYHGTDEEFSVFNKDKIGVGYWFSEDKDYAFSHGQRLMSVYLSISNPLQEFNLWEQAEKCFGANVTEKDIFSNRFKEYLIKLGYDGLIFEHSGADTIIVFNSSQIKSADLVTYDKNGNIIPLSQRFNSENDSILYSEREDISIYELMGEKERLQKQNKEFKAELERLRERLSIERKVTNKTYIDNNKALVAAGHIRNIANSIYDKIRLAKEIQGIYSYIGEADSKSEALFRKCYEIADNVLREAKEEKVIDDHFKSILKDIRTTRISLDDMQKQEARYLFGDHYNRSFMGRVIIAEDGISLDSKWKEWAEKYPDQFDADVNPNDQIGVLYDIINTLQEASETVVEYDAEERKRWLTYEIFNTFWNLPTVETVADKYDKRIKQIRAEHREAMTKLRNEYKDRLGKQRIVDDIHYGRKLSELKKSSEESLAEQKKADRERFKQIYANIRERKDAEIALAKEHGREMLSSYKERAEMRTRIQSITSNVLTLNEWLIKNSKEKHIHESLKGPVMELISAIDFSSKRLLNKGVPTKKDVSLLNALRHIEDKLGDLGEGDFTFYDIYGSDVAEDIKNVIKAVEEIESRIGDKEFILQEMSLSELKMLDNTIRIMKHAVIEVNKFHTVNHAKGIIDLAGKACEEMDKLGAMKYKGELGKALTNLDWNNTTPYYAFRRYGDSAFKVFESYMDGYDKIAFGQKAAIDFTNSLYTDKDVRKWEKTIYEFNITQRDGKERNFKMSLPQIMELYCSYKQDDVREHFLSGITLTEVKKGKQAEVVDNILLDDKHYLEIFSKLNEHPDAKKVADSLHEYMGRVGAKLINEISMARWGIKTAGVTNYYPIKVSKGRVDKLGNVKEEKMAIQNELYSLINAGLTKNRKPGANQSVLIGNIFDTFATHMAEVITYNAMALPVLDALKWFNYRGKDGFGKEFGTQTSMLSAFGTGGTNYFTQLIKDINGVKKSMSDGIYSALLRNYKISAVGASLKVALLQPTAYVKAYALIDAKYLIKGAKLSDLATRKGSKKAQKYCGAALQKSMGYVDTHMSRGLANEIKHTKTIIEKLREFSMKGAEFADDYTFGCLWNACELEVRDKRKDLKVGSEEFYKAISDRMREVIYSTQVMDNTLTRSQIMRNPDGKARELTMFMSEPTLGYNMVMDAFISYSLDKKRYGKEEAKSRHKHRIGRVLAGYTLTNALAAVVETAFSALLYGDDEEDENFVWKEFLKNFALNMSLLGKITYFKDVVSIFQGFDTTRVETNAIVNFFEALGAWKKVFIDGKSNQGYKAVSKSIETISQLTGLPFYKLFQQTTNLFFSYEELKEMFADFMD